MGRKTLTQAEMRSLFSKDYKADFEKKEEEKARQKEEEAAHKVLQEAKKALRDEDRNPTIDLSGKNWFSDQQQTFINPYNFVRFDGGNPPARKAPENGNLTGWVSCTLTTKTPLIILDTEKKQVEEITVPHGKHNIYKFFQLPDASGKSQPAIPGSTLRGAVRALYESASGSCIPVDAGDDITLSTRVENRGSAKTRALLCYDKAADTWSLMGVEKDAYGKNFDGTSEDGFRLKYKESSINRDGTLSLKGYPTPFAFGQAIRFQKEDGRKEGNWGDKCEIAIPVQDGPYTGYLQFVPPFSGKPFSPRMLAPSGKVIQTWPAGDNASARELAKVLEFYIENANATTGKNTVASPYVALDHALKDCKANGGCVPVWVLEVDEGGKTDRYLTCSSVGRIIMRNTWDRLLGGYKSCSDMDALCPACRLFGNAYKDVSYAGHLRFGDAHLQAGCTAALLPPRTLAELAGPKPTATVFYTHRPEDKNGKVTSWNYDYYTVGKDEKRIEKPEESLLGRKAYWHHTPDAAPAAAPTTVARHAAPPAIEKTKRNCTAIPMDAGASFDFCIYFEQITQQQLDELLWVCTLGENTTSSNLQQKIGYAKPLGYGSVKITVNEVCTRTLAQNPGGQGLCYQIAKADYTTQSTIELPRAFQQQKGATDKSKKGAIDDILALCDASRIKRIAGTSNTRVCYPLGSNSKEGANADASHQWFAGNKVLDPTGYVMPAPTDTDEGQKLPRIVQTSKR